MVVGLEKVGELLSGKGLNRDMPRNSAIHSRSTGPKHPTSPEDRTGLLP